MIAIGGIRIHDLHKMGVVPIKDALAHSSDVAAVKVGMKVGDQRLYNYIRGFGFGQQTGIELPGETKGMARPVNRWSKVSIGAISIGQEIGVTALQLASMVSSIANDGLYTPPRIVAGVLPPRKTPQTVTFQRPQQHRVISTLAAAEMKQMLEGVVLFGTGRRAILDGYTSAGKTGTAQKVDPATHTYSRTKYVATFAGFAPVNNPVLTIVVSLDSAVGLHQGGQISAPVFARVAQQVLAYMNVPHDAELKNAKRLQLRAAVKDEELNEDASDRLGGTLHQRKIQPGRGVLDGADVAVDDLLDDLIAGVRRADVIVDKGLLGGGGRLRLARQCLGNAYLQLLVARHLDRSHESGDRRLGEMPGAQPLLRAGAEPVRCRTPCANAAASSGWPNPE